ncbi:MAG: glycosyltransferase family 4 protein [Caldilineaceae bacterium]
MKASAGKRILMLLENNPYPHDGRVRREATALVQAGYQVSVISPRRHDQGWRDTLDGVHVYRYPAPPSKGGIVGYLLEYGYSLIGAFVLSLVVWAQRGFDVIHAHNPPDIFVLIALPYKLLGKRFVFDHHDLSPEMYNALFKDGGNPLLFRMLVWFEQLSCKVADHLIATNESYKRMEMERSGVPAERISVVRNGPDLKRVRLVEPDSQLRSKGKTIIGYVGIMGFQDGLDYLLRALHHLVYDLGRTDFYCVLIGTGDAWETLKQMVDDLQLHEQVWLTGNVSDTDLMRYLSSTDICVDPDPSNPFTDRCSMIKMTEYMALNKPIVAFDLPEHRVTAQEACLYAKANDELDFARKLAELMDDPAQRASMGKLGRQRVETALAWHYSVPHLLDAYRKVLAAPVVDGASEEPVLLHK